MADNEQEEYVKRKEFENHKKNIYAKVDIADETARRALLTAEKLRSRQHETELQIASINPTLKSIDKQMERFIGKVESTEDKVQEHEVKFADLGFESKGSSENKSEAAKKLTFWGIALPVAGAIVVALIGILPAFFK
ncbi:TPA: hypothetical protein ACGX6L_002117 [Listeria monocytogenes]